MVGVPRSGGCHTCRRRKIRCDQERPVCRRCRHDVRECEGYERWATFVNRTASGFQRRQRLEEAIVRPVGSLESLRSLGSTSSAAVSVRSSVPSLVPPPRPPSWIGPAPSVAATATATAAAAASGSSIDTTGRRDLLPRFLELYLPSSPSGRGGSTVTWLSAACELADPSPILRLALHALAAGRVADAEGDEALAQAGTRSYGEALALLQRVLSKPGAVGDDQVLAAARCLMLYELFESTTSSAGAWESHERGIVDMVMMRGPEGFSSSFSAAVLDDVRAVNMILCVHHSVGSPFVDEKWRVSGDITTLRQLEHRVLDLGFDLLALYEEEDSSMAAGELDAAKLTSLIQRMDDVAARFEEALFILPSLRPPSNPAPGEHEFWDVESCIIVAIGRTLLLDASVCIHDMLDRRETDGAEDAEDAHDEPPSPPPAPFVQRQDPNWHEELGTRIVSAVEHMTREESGIYGAQRAIFPLRMVLNVLPGDRDCGRAGAYARAAVCYGRLITRRRLRHAEDLAELLGGPEETGGNGSGDGQGEDESAMGESKMPKAPSCGCGEDCGMVNSAKGRSRWCGCPWAKRP